MTAETLPAVNAVLNATATVLLMVGYVLIRGGRWRAHAVTMIAAVIVSAAFLAGYLWHKSMFPPRSIGLPHGTLRSLYLWALLLPHTVLAMAMLPMIGLTLWNAARRRWTWHRRIARPTLWIWLYVSITGVMIYVLLYHWFPGTPA